MTLDFLNLLIRIMSGIIVTAPSLWVTGRMIIGKKEVKFTDALWIVVLGIVVEASMSVFIESILTILIEWVIWLYLVRRFFDTGWIKAFIVSIISIVVSSLITILIEIIGFML